MISNEARDSMRPWGRTRGSMRGAWLAHLRDEIVEVWLITAYFVAAFGVFIGLKALLLLDYGVQIHVIVPTFLSATVVAKAVAISRKLRIRPGAHAAPLWVSVVMRTIGYSAAALAATLAEELFETRSGWGTLAEGIWQILGSEHLGEHIALVVFISIALFVMNVFEEIIRHFGLEALRNLFGRPRSFPVDAAPSEDASLAPPAVSTGHKSPTHR